nr:ribonuclease H-like domain-containing protein [Tanacetum cinerariifolium]
MKGIKREYSNAKTPQQNRVTERENRTLIKAARTMLADSLLHVTFWAETVNTTCYVLNWALVTKTHNKTPYELLNGRSPRLDFMRPFGCPITILNTLDPLGKFEGKADEGFLIGYSVTSKAFRVFNAKTKKVEENLDVSAYDDDLDIYTSPVQSVGAKADFNNMESSTIVSPIPTHKMEPKKVSQALDDESWVEAMQEELLQFSLQKVWRLVDMPYGNKAIGTK